MAIGIYLQTDEDTFEPGEDAEFVASIEDEGCHYFLCSIFQKIEHKVDHAVDLWAGVAFADPELDILSHQIVEARKSIDTKPDTWTEFAGFTSSVNSSIQEEVHIPLKKHEIVDMLDTIEATVEKAKSNGLFLAIYGD